MEDTKNKPEGLKVATVSDDSPNGGVDFLSQLLNLREETMKVTAKLETAIDKMGKMATVDAHSPAAVAERTEAVGVTKGKLNTISTVLLGILAGVFIGLGGMFYTVVTTDIGLGFGLTKLIGGLAFCLGLILVVVAGAELFTGNTLIVMSWISGRTSFARLMRNWGLVYAANFIGALSLVALMYFSRQWASSNYGVGANALAIANAKVNLTFGTALVRGILCNALVCLAIWLCFSARTVVDKILAIVFPITAFVAAGFEHSIANMYFLPIGILMAGQEAVLKAAGLTAASIPNLNWVGLFNNLIPVTIGNIIGGSVLIGVVYWMAYLRNDRSKEMVAARPWISSIIPTLRQWRLEEPVRVQIDELLNNKRAEPAMLERGGKGLLGVLAKARNDSKFLAKLSENPSEAVKDLDLTAEEKAALSSGDIKWVESRLGKLDEPLRTWLTARLSQEKW